MAIGKRSSFKGKGHNMASLKFKLEIACDNAAFGDSPSSIAAEVERILRSNPPDNIDVRAVRPRTLRDSNGNTVGSCRFYKSRNRR